jgi:RNA polymerase sigma-70 factor (family 1)
MGDTINAELIRDLKLGKQQAFDTIFKKYYTFLCIEAKGYFKNAHLVEEIVCDVFTKLWQNKASLDIEISLREYLHKAVHNNCINYYRMQKVQERLKQEVDEKQKRAFSLADIGQNPLEYTIMNEFEDRVKAAIELLPPRYKQAFKLSRFDNLTYEEIAEEMGISINGVKMNIKKALEFLREKLSDYLTTIIILLLSSIFF